MAEKFSPQYELGAGAFGRAIVVENKESKKKFVAKIIQIKNLSEAELDRCVTEVLVLGSCHHRNIIQYVEAFVEQGSLHIIMQYANGGDLHNKILERNGAYFQQETILDWFVQITLALEYIHSKNILHRDLKPQNVFLMRDGTVKLGDFGIARILSHGDDLASTRIGTPFYISPEICAGNQYNSSSDMWAVGCLLFEMTLLRVPFNAASLSALTRNIIQCQFDQIPRCFGQIIPNLISRLIVFEPERRLTASQVLQHPKLSELTWSHRKQNQEYLNSDVSKPQNMITVNRGNTLKETKSNNKTIGKDQVRPFCPHRESDKSVEAMNNYEIEGPRTSKEIAGNETEGKIRHEPEVDRPTIYCKANNHSLEQSQHLNGRSPKQRQEFHGQDVQQKRPRSYSLRDSVIRKLSVASPTLSETVRIQRLSLGENNINKEKNGLNVSDVVTSDVMNDVFTTPSEGDKENIKKKASLTYTVFKPPACKESTKTNDENNNTYVTADINSTLILALSESRSNVDLAKDILLDALTSNIGRMRSEYLLHEIEQFVEEGQPFSTVQKVLNRGEDKVIPLISMILCLSNE